MAAKMTQILLFSVVAIAFASAAPMDQDVGYEVDPGRAELLSYLAGLDPLELRQLAQLAEYYGGMRSKRWGRYGDKYADNKSYGFWITALNKAGNYKRGKRSEPFIPAMSAPQPPISFINTMSGEKKQLKELVPDHDYSDNN